MKYFIIVILSLLSVAAGEKKTTNAEVKRPELAGPGVKIVRLEAFDANPKFNFNTLPTELKPSQLLRARALRDGAAADGVSQLIIKAEVSHDNPVHFEIKSGRGSLKPLLKGETIEYQKKFYSFCLYTPPETFGPGTSKQKPTSLLDRKAQPKQRIKGILEYEPLEIEAFAAAK